tara:strand:+ start:191 stop:1048 length:858 start_codon:yes stop_codon:yes gene_type:complete
MKKTTFSLLTLMSALLILASGSANAGHSSPTPPVADLLPPWDWNLNNSGTSWSYNPTGVSEAGHKLSLQAYSSTGDVANAADTIETATLASYGTYGLGVINTDTGSSQPEHAFGGSSFDDPFENMDAVLLSFDEVTTLQSVTIGWNGGYDSDFSLMAYTGSGTPASLLGVTYDSLDQNGWSLVGHYYDAVVGTPTAVNTGSTVYSSSYYLLSVLNPELNGAGCSSGQNTRTCASDGSNDYFKLLAVRGTPGATTPPPPGVPVPPTAFLFLAALPLIRLTRRAKAA